LTSGSKRVRLRKTTDKFRWPENNERCDKLVLMWHRLYRRLPRIVLIAALLCGLTSCAAWPSAEVNFKPHDKALFERAMSAIWRKRFTVANLTLRTLANIYPDSDYARKAGVALQDPQIAKCGESWSTDPDCD